MVFFYFIIILNLISFDKALQINSKDLFALNNKGNAFYILGKYLKAIDW